MTNAELDDRMAELLTGYNVMTPAALDRARTFQRARGSTLAGALRELQLVPPETIAPLLEELTGVRAVDPSLMTVYPDFVEKMNVLIAPEVVAKLLVFPAQTDLNAIHVCMLNPTDGVTAKALESLSGCRIVPFVSHEAALTAAISKHYASYLQGVEPRVLADGAAVAEKEYRSLIARPFDDFLKPAVSLMNRNRDAVLRDAGALEHIVRDPIVIRLVQQILARAVESGASDVHIEPVGDALRIRVRVDGAMRVAHVLPANATAPVVARLKAMAELPIRQRRAALGSLRHRVGTRHRPRFFARAAIWRRSSSTCLDRSRQRRDLADLGMDPGAGRDRTTAALPNGLLLVTGTDRKRRAPRCHAPRSSERRTPAVTAEDPSSRRVAGSAGTLRGRFGRHVRVGASQLSPSGS